jgi:queuine tRNA-ribosyltransferase
MLHTKFRAPSLSAFFNYHSRRQSYRRSSVSFYIAAAIKETSDLMPLEFKILGRFNRARASQLTLPHYECRTPLFMPVGTQGTIKGLTTEQLEDIGCQIILGNTYHLALRPTSELISELGGLHEFMNWPRALLTDSGGFQMVSLLHLADITEEGVTFQSPVDGKPMLLTPEESIQIQNRIGADIIMALDDVVKTTITGPRIEEAMYRTLRWIDRCIDAHQRPKEQNLFGIVQGGLDPILRDICVKGLVERDLPGYAIGGLAGGEDKDSFWRVVAQCTAALPEDKPRYVMGVGYPLDIVVCSALGADMYDCVYPTRTARFGTALVPEGVLKLKHQAMADDVRPVDPSCKCMVCRTYSRAYIHCLVTKDAMGSQLLSYHNLYYMLKLSRDLHWSIVEGKFPQFVCQFLRNMFPEGDVPEWVCNAMEVAGIDISSCCAPFPDLKSIHSLTKNTQKLQI